MYRIMQWQKNGFDADQAMLSPWLIASTIL